MALNTTGPISLAGATAGQSIAVELSLGTTTQISLNDTAVRTLAGVATGAIIMPTNFYGKSSVITTGIFYAGFTSTNTMSNTVTRINACGALIGAQTTVGTARKCLAGAAASGTAIYYAGLYYTCCGGCTVYNYTNTVTRINSSGAIVGTEANVSSCTPMRGASPIGANAVFYAGGRCNASFCNSVTRLNSSGTLVGTTASVGTARGALAGAPVSTNGLYYGGLTAVGCCGGGCLWTAYNTVTRINACGALVGSETTAGTARGRLGGAAIGANGVFYGGWIYASAQATVTRINSSGAIVGTQTSITPATQLFAGTKIGSIGAYYGGNNGLSTVTRINACGTLFGSKTTIGTARRSEGSAGL